MGIELVKLVLARHAAGLTQRALLVLGYMAVHALDKPNERGQPPRLYFAGWEPLALAMGYESLTDAAEEKIRRAVKELREAGLIEPQARARTGTRQVYRLQIGLAKSPTDSEGQDATSPTDPEGQSPTDSEGLVPHRSGVHSPTDPEGPRTHQESGQDLAQEFISKASASVTGPRARGPWHEEPHPHIGEREDACETCGRGALNLVHRHPKESARVRR